MSKTNVTHYSDSLSETDFYITENDMADLDLFFMYKDGQNVAGSSNKVKIIREPITYFSVASHTQTLPCFQLGSSKIVGYSSGNTIYAGKIIINAFSNIPFVNSILGTNTKSGKVEDIPPMDLYIINKRNAIQKRYFQDLAIKNFKITSWNFEQGVDTPGRFVIAEFISSDFQGIHLKKYVLNQVFGEKDVNLSPEVVLEPSNTVSKNDSKNFGTNTNPITKTAVSGSDSSSNADSPFEFLNKYSAWVKSGYNWTTYNGNRPTNIVDIALINNTYLKIKDTTNFKNIVDKSHPNSISKYIQLYNQLVSALNSFVTTYDSVISSPSNANFLQSLKNDDIINDNEKEFYNASSTDINLLIKKITEITLLYNKS